MFREPLPWIEMKSSQELRGVPHNQPREQQVLEGIYVYRRYALQRGIINISLAPRVVHILQYIHCCGVAGLPVDGTHPFR